MIAAAGVGALLRSRARAARWLGVACLVAAPVIAWSRVHQRFGGFTEREFTALRRRVDRHVPEQARVTVQDRTPAIQLYRVGRHGWTFAPDAPDETILAQHAEGATYAIWLGQTPSPALTACLEIVERDSGIVIGRFVDR
jgi:hypothetical protein